MKMKARFFYLLVINSILAHFLLYTPTNLHKRLYEGALISILIALAINCINAYMVMHVFNKYKENNITEIYEKLFGRFIGGIFSLAYLVLNLAISFFMFRGLIEIVIKYMLPSTPIYLIAMTLIILPFSNLYNNERSYLRYIGLISVVVIFYTLVQIMLIMKNINLGYIKGVFTHSHFKPDLTSIAVAGYFFSGVSHLSIYNPVFSKLSPARTCLLFLTFGIFTASFTILAPAGIWGPVAVQKVQLIWIVTSDTLSTELFIIERVLYILLPLFFLLAASQVLNYGFAGYTAIKILIPNRKTYLLLACILGVIYVVLSQYIQGTERVLGYGTAVMIIAFCAYHLSSLLMFIFCKVREGRVNNEEIN
jgi:hypothetical protein